MGITNIIFIFVMANYICKCRPCSRVHRAGEISSLCIGSITIYDDENSSYNFPSSVDSLRKGLKVGMVKLEGCGCYRLYEKTYRRGKSHFVTRRGRQKIGLKVVKSVFNENCSLI